MEIVAPFVWTAVDRSEPFGYAQHLSLAATHLGLSVLQGNIPNASGSEPLVYQQLAGALAGSVATPNSQSEPARQSARYNSLRNILRQRDASLLVQCSFIATHSSTYSHTNHQLNTLLLTL